MQKTKLPLSKIEMIVSRFLAAGSPIYGAYMPRFPCLQISCRTHRLARQE